jgi:NADP-dependent 3-hydroxy acid dehydrogenase YdfG
VLRPTGFPLTRWKAVARGQAAGPEDVAAAVLFFATCPHHITGQVLGVD